MKIAPLFPTLVIEDDKLIAIVVGDQFRPLFDQLIGGRLDRLREVFPKFAAVPSVPVLSGPGSILAEREVPANGGPGAVWQQDHVVTVCVDISVFHLKIPLSARRPLSAVGSRVPP